ncbi:MAG: transcription antitermination factor NusB [Pseudomonadota bacterium]
MSAVPGRRRSREIVLQALYDADLAGTQPGLALRGLWSALLDDDGSLGEAGIGEDERRFANALVQGVQENTQRIDALIEEASLNWRLVRMPVVDRNILRLACYELIGCPEIPVSVTINEAVELAKRFGGDDSRAFVNGILDRVAHDLGRGGRGPRRGA